jgi:hypothetical protein
MVVTDFHIISVIVIAPNKADTVRVDDPYAAPAFPISLEGFKAIAGRISEIVHHLGGIQNFKFSASGPFYFTETLHRLAFEKALSILASKGLDHDRSV